MLEAIIGGIIGLIIGAAAVFFVPYFKKQRAQANYKKIIRDAEIKAEHITKNAQLDGKQTIIEMKQEANKEIQERKQEVAAQENKLMQREQNIDRRDQMITQKETAVLMIDVDFFKKINDTYGHETGDAVLKYLAAKLKDMII